MMSKPVTKPTELVHEVAYQELSDLLKKHAGELRSDELLAVAANMVGKLVALQDKRTVTVAQAMELVARNIQYGNQQMIEQLKDEGAGHA